MQNSRHAGTGTQTAWGWPRMIHVGRVSWETPERIEAVHWHGVAENTIFYGAIAVLVGGVGIAGVLRMAVA